MDVNHTLKDTSKDSNDDLKNTTDDEYLQKMQGIFASIQLPSNFDDWTVQEQGDWMYHNMTELYQNVPETLQYMIPAIIRPFDFDRSQEKLPEWMDIDKYRRGQKFVRDNFFSIAIGILLGTIYGLTFDDGIKPLIISGNSCTAYLAFKRYLNTIVRMFNWLNGEPWIKGTKAYKDMKIARIKHMEISTKMSRMSTEQLNAASKIADPLCSERELLLKDFAVTCPFGQLEQRPYKKKDASLLTRTAINNTSMSVLQGNFLLLPIIYPENIGIHNVTDEDLDAFCHMWKCYGYFLGMEDEYNFCHGSLEEVKQRLKDLSRYWITVNFTEITPEWTHMTRCLVESINYYPLLYFPYKTMVLLFTEMLNLKMPNLYASLSYGEWAAYKFYNFLFRQALKFSVVRSIANRLLCKVFETASNFGPDKLAELQKKSRQHLLEFSNKS